MAKKKVVFVIVEGISDSEALGLFFIEHFNPNLVHVEIMRKDITTERGVTSTNILNKLTEVIKNYITSNKHFIKSDIKEIIHIVDTDGCFIEDNLIVEDGSINEITYTENNIFCINKKDIVERNIQKRSIINKLINCGFVWTNIPYKMYYMSSDLEHVLHDKLNATDDEKGKLAHIFARKYRKNLKGFIDYISNSSFSKCTSYDDSWDFIKKDNNSLKRYTNLGLCFK